MMAAPTPCPNDDVDHAAASAPSAKMKLTQRRDLGVMIELDRQA